MKITEPINRWSLVIVLLMTAWPIVASAQTPIQIQLRTGPIECFDSMVKLKHIAEFPAGSQKQLSVFRTVDLDSFEDRTGELQISKEQIRIRLMLAGHRPDQFRIIGPDSITVVRPKRGGVKAMLEHQIQRQLADQFGLPMDDLQITLSRHFKSINRSDLDFSSLDIQPLMQSQPPLGRHTVDATIEDESGQAVTLKIPVTVAMLRELVVAKRHLQKGEILGPEHVKTVRRPISSRHVRFASYEQTIGQQIKSDIQKYDLINSSSLKTPTAKSAAVVKKNSRVNIVVQRGPLRVILKDARALENGRVGDTISLINPQTNEKISADVIDASTVKLNY